MAVEYVPNIIGQLISLSLSLSLSHFYFIAVTHGILVLGRNIRQKVFENKILRRIFGPKRYENCEVKRHLVDLGSHRAVALRNYFIPEDSTTCDVCRLKSHQFVN